MKFLFESLKMFHKWAQQASEIVLNTGECY